MSIFDRKRSVPEPERAPDQDIWQPQPHAQQHSQPQPPQSQPVSVTKAPTYSIQKAMELMRSLPSDNIPLIVHVVRTTLESLNVDVVSIIEDAKAKRARIGARIEGLRREISNFEEEIAARREEIVALEADQAETKLVQERLEMALEQRGQEVHERAAASQPPPSPPAVAPRPPAVEGPVRPTVIKPPSV